MPEERKNPNPKMTIAVAAKKLSRRSMARASVAGVMGKRTKIEKSRRMIIYMTIRICPKEEIEAMVE